jgi:hypothetical protein
MRTTAKSRFGKTHQTQKTGKAGKTGKKNEARPSVQAEPKKDKYTRGVGKTDTVSGRAIEQLRLDVSRAVDKLSVDLYDDFKAASTNPVLASVLITTLYADLMPTFTAAQQKKLLGDLGLSELSPEEFVRGAKAFSAHFNQGLAKDVTLKQATFAYAQQGEALNPDITSESVKQIDFRTEGGKINTDISNATDNEIEELIEPDEVANLESFIAAAAYIDAPWGGGLEFNPAHTQPGDFAGAAGQVRMMHSNLADQRIVKGKDFEAVFLQNGGSGGLGTIYVKPLGDKTLDAFIGEKGAAGLREIVADAANPMTPTQRGAVRIPKSEVDFKPKSDLVLQVLRKHGLPGSAKLLKSRALQIAKAAYVGVAKTTEYGIKMAAAAGVGGTRSLPPPLAQPVVFDGNRSMLQIVVKDGQILFFNPLTDPSAKAAA